MSDRGARSFQESNIAVCCLDRVDCQEPRVEKTELVEIRERGVGSWRPSPVPSCLFVKFLEAALLSPQKGLTSSLDSATCMAKPGLLLNGESPDLSQDLFRDSVRRVRRQTALHQQR